MKKGGPAGSFPFPSPPKAMEIDVLYSQRPEPPQARCRRRNPQCAGKLVEIPDFLQRTLNTDRVRS
jgi:hypothetical protein